MSRRPSRIERLRVARAATPPPIETVEDKLPSRPKRAAALATGRKSPSVTAPATAGADRLQPEQPTMLTLSVVPLKRLRLSELNVRKTNSGEDIKELAANIAAHGLKQNLVVVPGYAPDTFEVVAGGRRLQALQLLWDEGIIDGEKTIAVLVEPVGEGRATSLDENLHRIAMNPADECTAYATIVSEHASKEDPFAYCAGRFGVTRAHVEQRLRLADLAPEIFVALRDGQISLEAGKAYGCFANHELQLQVFHAESKRTHGTKHDPRNIRDALKSKTYPAGIAQAVYVGIDAYVAAGGGVERELFMGAEDGERLTSPSLLDRLAREKAAVDLVEVAKRDGFASAELTKTFGPYPQWPPQPTDYLRPSAYGKTIDDFDKDRRAVSIGVYSLAGDGSGLKWEGMFEPSVSHKQHFQNTNSQFAAERAAQRRLQLISERAAQIAARPFIDSSPLEGRTKLVGHDEGYIYPVMEFEDEPGVHYVAVLVRVTDEEIAAHETEAQAEIDAEERRSAEAEAAEASDADSDDAPAVQSEARVADAAEGDR